MSGGFSKGTSADQDTRFSNKQAKLLKTQKFAPELEHLVDTSKVEMDVMKPWIANRVTELLGFEDEVLINFIYGLLEAKEVNGKEAQIQLTGFMEKHTSRPDIHVEKAHVDDITGLKFSSDGCLLLSRSFDSTLKVWDLRQMKQSLKVFDELPNNYAQTNVSFSLDEQLILTGTSVERENLTGGLLCFYDREKLELVSRVRISPTYSAVQCAWHPKLNQN